MPVCYEKKQLYNCGNAESSRIIWFIFSLVLQPSQERTTSCSFWSQIKFINVHIRTMERWRTSPMGFYVDDNVTFAWRNEGEMHKMFEANVLLPLVLLPKACLSRIIILLHCTDGSELVWRTSGCCLIIWVVFL